MKTKKILSSVVLAATMLLNFSGTVFALTVSETSIITGTAGLGYQIYDMIVGSNGAVHAVDNTPNSINQLNYRSSNQVDYLGENIDTASLDVNYYASIALDSSGYPGVAWREWNSVANTSKIYYKKYNGTSWGTTIEVATGLENVSAVPALGFYRTASNGVDYATIVSCAITAGSVVIAEYKATSANLSPSFAAPVTISSNSAHQCSGADLYVSSTDTLILAVAPNSQITSAFSFVQEAGTWSSASTVFTSVGVQNTSNIYIDANSDNEVSAVIISDAAGAASDSILYNQMVGGSWGTQSTIASGSHLGQEGIDVAIDQNNAIPYVFYFDNINAKIKYAYYTSSWTIGDVDTGLSLNTFEGDYLDYVAADDYATGSKMIVLANMYLTALGDAYVKYELTDLATQGGVPEFSTFIYTMTALMLFGMVYWKSEGGKLQNA